MSRIHVVRGQKVMLDSDLGPLFGVEVKRLKEQARRNIERFPEDFMFELTEEESANLRSQFATSSHGGARYHPFAFTERGVLMLSNVLRSERAVLMSIQIIRVFTRMRELLLTHKDLLLELEKLRNTSKAHAGKIAVIFKYLKQMEQRQQETELLEEVRRKPRPVVGYKRLRPDPSGVLLSPSPERFGDGARMPGFIVRLPHHELPSVTQACLRSCLGFGAPTNYGFGAASCRTRRQTVLQGALGLQIGL